MRNSGWIHGCAVELFMRNSGWIRGCTVELFTRNSGQGSKFAVATVANATMFCHLLPGGSSGSKHLLLP